MPASAWWGNAEGFPRIGIVVGTAVKIALAFTMLGLMIVMYFV